MTRLIYDLIFIVFFIIYFSPQSFGGKTKCDNWLPGSYKGEIETGIELKRETSRDNRGLVIGQCEYGFPTVNERMRIIRIGEDPFDQIYSVSRQFCTFGNKHWCGDTWNLNFSKIKHTEYAGAYSFWLEKIMPGEIFPYSANKKNNTNQTKICAYRLKNTIGSIFGIKHGPIGCIDELLKPTPPGFSQVVPANNEPYVDYSITRDQLIQLGSRFDQPLVRLKYFDKVKGNEYLYLQYKFDKIVVYKPNQPLEVDKFKFFPISYRAKVPEGASDQVCVCADVGSNCDNDIFIGCVPRPTPEESNLAFVADYEAIQENGLSLPGVRVYLAHTDNKQRPILINKKNPSQEFIYDGTKYIDLSHSSVATNVTANDLQFKQVGFLSVSIKEYYKNNHNQLLRDIKSFYGIKLKALITEVDQKGQPIKKNIRTAKFRDCSDPGICDKNDGCIVTTSENNTKLPAYFMPAGNRDRSLCCPDTIAEYDENNNLNTITLTLNEKILRCDAPPYQTICRGSEYSNPPMIDKNKINPILQDTDAEAAVCPGYYTGPQINTAMNAFDEFICIMSDRADSAILKQPYCTRIPNYCDPVTIPSQASGYALWNNASSNANQIGFCEPKYGFEKRLEFIINGSSDNVPQDVKDRAAHQNRNIDFRELNQVLNPQAYPLVPSRTCLISTLSTPIQNPCVIKSGCGNITKSSAFTGNAIFSNPKINNQLLNFQYIGSKTITLDHPGVFELDVQGTCDVGYAPVKLPSGIVQPSLKCKALYYVDSNNKNQMIAEFWDLNNVTNPCVKINP